MQIEPEISRVDIVVLGAFNPLILTPAWFVLHGLLPKGIESSADVQIVHEFVTEFTSEWLELHVTKDRFVMGSAQAPYVRVCDLVVRIFKSLLPDATLRAVGINREVLFLAQSQAVRNRVGRKLAPVEPWGKCGRSLRLDNAYGGMRSLTMSQLRPDERAAGGQINIKVERQPELERGILVSVNDHYALDGQEPGSGKRFAKILVENFESSLRRSDEIIDHVMSLAKDLDQ